MNAKKNFIIFSILFIKGLCAYNLQDYVVSFFRSDNQISHSLTSYHQFHEKILHILATAPNSTQNLIKNLSLRNATADDLRYFYPTAFNFISDQKLKDVSGRELAILFNRVNEDVNLLTRFLGALKNEKELINFLVELADDRLNPDGLRIVAEDLIKASTNYENALDLLTHNRWLLLSAPPSFLLKLKEIYKNFLLFYGQYMAPEVNKHEFWKKQSQLTKRTWSKIIFESNSAFLNILREYSDEFYYLLEGANLKELENFLKQDEKLLNSELVHWNTLQIRKIIDWFSNENPSRFLPHMLPQQIQSMSDEIPPNTPHRDIKILNDLSLSTAIQLFEYFKAANDSAFTSRLDVKNTEFIAKLLHSQSNDYFLSQIYNKTIPMNIIKRLDSAKYSFLQAHYILGENYIRGVKNNLLNLKQLLVAIPASVYENFIEALKIPDEAELDQMFEYTPGGNKIKALAILRLCKTLDYTNCTEKAINSTNNDFISSISPWEISRKSSQIFNFLSESKDNILKRRVANLPTYVLTELLRKEGDITYEDLFEDSHPLNLVIMGLDCEILSKIPISDFLPIFEFYNRQRRYYHKRFPKDLQKCAQNQFLSYLESKSLVMTGKIDEGLVQHLDLADIRSVGGYILVTFPVNIILMSKYRDDIVQEIGRLSLPELMLAAPKNHLVSLTSEYLKKTIGEGDVDLELLLRLGNLIHFLNAKYLKKISYLDFRFILEAETIDTRLCATFEIRKLWEELVIRAFGSPETWQEDTVLKIGDMLIAMNSSALDKLNESVRTNVADLVKSKYTDSMEWVPRDMPFYEVCLATFSNDDERKLYKSLLKDLALFYAISIENQLKTIKLDYEITNADIFEHFQYCFSSEDAENTEKPPSSKTTDKNPAESLSTFIAEMVKPTTSNVRGREVELHREEGTPSVVTIVNSDDLRSLSEVTTSESIDTHNIITDFISIFNSFNTVNKEKITTSPSESVNQANESTFKAETVTFDSEQPSTSVDPVTVENTTNLTNITVSEIPVKNTTLPMSIEERPTVSTTEVVKSVDATMTISDVSSYQVTGEVLMRSEPSEDHSSSSSTASISKTVHNFTTEATQKNGSLLATATFSLPLSSSVEQKLNNSDSKSVFTVVHTTPSQAYTTTDRKNKENASGLFKYESISVSATTIANQTIAVTTTRKSEIGTASSIASNDSTDRPSTTTEYIVRTQETIAPIVSSFNIDSQLNRSDIENINTEINETIENYQISEKRPTASQVKRSPENISEEKLAKLLKIIVHSSNSVQNATSQSTNDSSLRQKREIVFKSKKNIDISCNTLKILGPISAFVVPSINITEELAFNCLELFSQMNLDHSIRKRILDFNWKLKPSNLLFTAKKLLSWLSEKDYEKFNLSLSSEWALELIDSISENLATSSEDEDRKLVQWIQKENDKYNSQKMFPLTATVALGNNICYLNDNMLRRTFLADEEFNSVWTAFHKIKNCPMTCLEKIGDNVLKIFKNSTKLKPSQLWMLGPVAAGIKEIRQNVNLLPYLHISAIECLPPEILGEARLKKIIEKMPLKSALFLIEKQNNVSASKYPYSLTSSLPDIIIKEDRLYRKEKNTENFNSNADIMKLNTISFVFLVLRFLV